METPASRKHHKTSFNLFPKYTRSRKNDQHGQFRLTWFLSGVHGQKWFEYLYMHDTYHNIENDTVDSYWLPIFKPAIKSQTFTILLLLVYCNLPVFSKIRILNQYVESSAWKCETPCIMLVFSGFYKTHLRLVNVLSLRAEFLLL